VVARWKRRTRHAQDDNRSLDKHERKNIGNHTPKGTRGRRGQRTQRHSLFGIEESEILHRQGTQVGLLGIYNFPRAVYATDGSNDKRIMGTGFYRLDEDRRGCSEIGRGEEVNSSNRAELRVACLALKDARKRNE